jgi:hypothetical protein
MVETYKVLEKKDSEKSSQIWDGNNWSKPISTPIWVGGADTITYKSGTCTNTAVSSVSGSNQ